MKKFLLIIAFTLVCILSFGQGYSPVERDLGKPLSEITPEEYYEYRYDVPIEDYTKNGSVVFYASPDKELITVYIKKTGKREVYPFGKVPEKYFHFVDNDGYYAHYRYLLCIYNGMYGCVSKNGKIVEDFKWNTKEYNIELIDDTLVIFNKDYSSLLKRITFDYE